MFGWSVTFFFLALIAAYLGFIGLVGVAAVFVKMLLLVFAGLNALMFHFSAYRKVDRWERGTTPFAAKFAGALSILLWFGIVAMGRWIAFF